jgi:hypothetical protein
MIDGYKIKFKNFTVMGNRFAENYDRYDRLINRLCNPELRGVNMDSDWLWVGNKKMRLSVPSDSSPVFLIIEYGMDFYFEVNGIHIDSTSMNFYKADIAIAAELNETELFRDDNLGLVIKLLRKIIPLRNQQGIPKYFYYFYLEK